MADDAAPASNVGVKKEKDLSTAVRSLPGGKDLKEMRDHSTVKSNKGQRD